MSFTDKFSDIATDSEINILFKYVRPANYENLDRITDDNIYFRITELDKF